MASFPAFGSATDCVTIKLRDHAFGVDLHPTRKLLAAGLISGQLKLYQFDAHSATQLSSAKPHKGSCRTVRFSADGHSMFSAGSDGSLQQRDLETNQPSWRRKAHGGVAVNSLTRLGEIGLATGDDEGVLKLWDLRQRARALQFHENSDFIADMLYTEQRGGHTLCAASGDGMLSVFDLRAGKLWARSDDQDDELLSLALLKGGNKLICGTESGTVGLFSWGDFGDTTDRLLGHPQSVDCIAALGDDHVLTGSSDGLVRLVGVHPNTVLGVVGEHADQYIEHLVLDEQQTLLASCGHDSAIRLWDVAHLHDFRMEDDEDDVEQGVDQGAVVPTMEEGEEEEGVGGGSEAAPQLVKSKAARKTDSEVGEDGADPSTSSSAARREAAHGFSTRKAGRDVLGMPSNVVRAIGAFSTDAAMTSGMPEAAPQRKKPKQIPKGCAAIKLGRDFFGGL